MQLTMLRAAVGALLNASLTFGSFISLCSSETYADEFRCADPIKDVLRQTSSLEILLAVIDCNLENGRSVAPIYSPSSWIQSSGTQALNQRLELGSTIVGWALNIISDVISQGKLGMVDCKLNYDLLICASPADKSTFPAQGITSLLSLIFALDDIRDITSLQCTTEEAAAHIDFDLDVAAQGSELIESLSLELESVKDYLGLQSYTVEGTTPILFHLLDFIEKSTLPLSYSNLAEDPPSAIKGFSKIKSAIVRASVEVPNSDVVMEMMFNPGDDFKGSRMSMIISRAVWWIKDPVEGREDLLICATHLLAALGRKGRFFSSAERLGATNSSRNDHRCTLHHSHTRL
jgi:hypothetical protein